LIVAGILIVTFRRWNRARKTGDDAGMSATAMSLMVQIFLIWSDSATDNHVDLCGLMFWMFVSLGFIPVSPMKKRERPDNRPARRSLHTQNYATAGSGSG